MTRSANLFLLLIFVSTPNSRAMECAEVNQYASSYKAALVNCIACNTTANQLSFADANNICPGVAAIWCMNNDKTCSKPGSGCTSAVATCETEKPKPNVNPTPNPSPNPKPTNPTPPVAGPTSPSSIDEDEASVIGKSTNPNTQNPNQGLQQQQAAPNQKSATGGTSGTTLPGNRSTTSLPPTQLPGNPSLEPAKGPKSGQSGLKVESKDARTTGLQNPKSLARDEFDNPIRSALPSLKVKAVPNNSGGAIPSSETSAQLSPKSQKTAPGSVYRKLGDLNTMSASGGGATSAPSQFASDYEKSHFSGDRRPSSDSSNEFQKIDLNSYLPGGVNDRRRRLLMGESLSTGEIHSRTVDLFRRITIRMAEFCANGQLFDCR